MAGSHQAKLQLESKQDLRRKRKKFSSGISMQDCIDPLANVDVGIPRIGGTLTILERFTAQMFS